MEIDIFKNGEIRQTLHNDELWFVVIDVVAFLTDSSINPSVHIENIRRRDNELDKIWEQLTIVLPINTQNGRQKLKCANTESIFRIIQSISSANAEHFKRWLAKVGTEGLQEIDNPELSVKRCRELYQAKGYSNEWIEKRMLGIIVRAELLDEWENRKVGNICEYSILKAEISKATFGITPSEHKKLKQLGRENLRDHMTELELIFSMLGEAATKEIAQTLNTQGFTENRNAAQKGGRIAGAARFRLEKESNQQVVSDINYFNTSKKTKYFQKFKWFLTDEKNA